MTDETRTLAGYRLDGARVILTYHEIATKLLIDESLRQYASLF